jgi:putative peptide zinc metalloprotease protein
MSATPEEVSERDESPQARLAIPLRLTECTELLGRYESSAFSQPQYLIRRGDGQIVQVGQLAYSVAASVNGERDGNGIASEMAVHLGRPVSVDNVAYLVKRKLVPLGILATEGASATLTRVNPLLGLRFRTRVVPERVHRGATWALQPLFRPPVILAVLTALVAVNAWMFTSRGTALVKGTHDLVQHPALLLLVIGLTIATGAFHELGHATATRYGGAKPGVMGVGIYLMMPAFYTDVSDSYRLSRRGRLRTDLGGVYFNAIAILVAAGAFLVTGSRTLLVFIVVSEIEMLYQFLPFVRMDGYYVVADLIGVPNLFAFVAPVFAALTGRPHPSRQRLNALTRRTRVAIRTWVGLTVPILAFDAFMFVLLAPHFFPGLWHSAQLFEKSAAFNLGRGDYIAAVDNGFQLLFLAIPAVGFALMAGTLGGRLFRRLGTPVMRPVRDHPRWVFATLAVATALLIAFIVPGGRIGEPQVPPQSAAGPRPAFGAPAPAMAVVNGHGRPANAFALVVVGTPPTSAQVLSPAQTSDGVTPTDMGTAPRANASAPGASSAGATRSTTQPGPAAPAGAGVPVSAPVGPPGSPVGTTITTPIGSVGAGVSAAPPSVRVDVTTPVASVGAVVPVPTPAAPVAAAVVATPVAAVNASLLAPPAPSGATTSSGPAPTASVATTASIPLTAAVASVSAAAPVASAASTASTATNAPVTVAAPTSPTAPTAPAAAPVTPTVTAVTSTVDAATTAAPLVTGVIGV